MFAFSVANEIINDDYEPQSITECRQRQDWPKWKEEIQAELASLAKRDVFGPVARTPENVILVGYKWVFVRKRNEKNEIVRYKPDSLLKDSPKDLGLIMMKHIHQ